MLSDRYISGARFLGASCSSSGIVSECRDVKCMTGPVCEVNNQTCPCLNDSRDFLLALTCRFR
jgi:hypothetical protein